jgi:glycosyltransferase involved in cell wall biosynthesis
LGKNDILVIAEVEADKMVLHRWNCKKIVFVQNAFYIYEGLERGLDYRELGFSDVFYYMPHLKHVLNLVTDLPLTEMPPFIAPHFFEPYDESKRKRQILLYPKFRDKEYDILKRLLQRHLKLKKDGFFSRFSKGNTDAWELIELKGKTHKEVSVAMSKAMFFVSQNTTEAFNSSVPEAMSRGCINFCYEGVGPADFLENGSNAFVFHNHHVYQLAESLIDTIHRFDELATRLGEMRHSAKQLADSYRIDPLNEALLDFFKKQDAPVNTH